MIRESDLDEAIAECQGERNPNASTCIKLAAFYTIKKHLYGAEKNEQHSSPPQAYSYSDGQEADVIRYESDTEFGEIINGRKTAEIMPIIDEIIDTIRIINPRLYDAALRKLSK